MGQGGCAKGIVHVQELWWVCKWQGSVERAQWLCKSCGEYAGVTVDEKWYCGCRSGTVGVQGALWGYRWHCEGTSGHVNLQVALWGYSGMVPVCQLHCPQGGAAMPTGVVGTPDVRPLQLRRHPWL